MVVVCRLRHLLAVGDVERTLNYVVLDFIGLGLHALIVPLLHHRWVCLIILVEQWRTEPSDVLLGPLVGIFCHVLEWLRGCHGRLELLGSHLLQLFLHALLPQLLLLLLGQFCGRLRWLHLVLVRFPLLAAYDLEAASVDYVGDHEVSLVIAIGVLVGSMLHR